MLQQTPLSAGLASHPTMKIEFTFHLSITIVILKVMQESFCFLMSFLQRFDSEKAGDREVMVLLW